MEVVGVPEGKSYSLLTKNIDSLKNEYDELVKEVESSKQQKEDLEKQR